MTASVSPPLLAVRRAVNAAALTAWLAASLRGGASADDVADAADAMGLHRVSIGTESHSLLLGLAAFRAQGWNRARLVLPTSGDPRGLPGPPALNARAVSAGAAFLLLRADPGEGEPYAPREAIVLVPCDVEQWPTALVPLPASVSSSWPTLRQARSEFVTSITGHSSALMELDVAGDAAGLREVVLDEDDQPLPALPGDFTAERRELLARARLVAILAATAQGDDGASVSAAEATSRAAHLRSLVGIARRAMAASVSPP